MKLVSTKQFAERHGISPRRVQVLLRDGRIKGAQRVGIGNLAPWVIPEKAELIKAAGPGRPRKRI